MILQTNTSMCQQILGISWYHQQEHQFPFGLACPLSCFANCLYAYNLTGLKKLHSKVKNGHKGCNYKRMSSKMVEIVDSSALTKGNMKNLPPSSEYEAAMEALSSLITRKKRGDKSHAPLSYNKLDTVLMYLKILGLEEHITGLKIIHVAGTKGKGSTCAFCEAILRECGFRTGLFTSPHLIDVRERFRLDGLDISEDKFLLYFWECWNQLKEKVTVDLPMPPLFQFLTVLAFKIFVSEKVDVAIIEVGLGGKEDSTNVIKEPIVCGITSLGMDHTEVLGNTLAEIALHKAGIFKCQIPAFTVPQLSEAMLALKERAHQLMVPLEVAAPLDYKKLNKLKLSLSGDHQLVNAGLAVSLCKSWLQSTGSWEKLFQDHDILEDNLPEAFLRGLSTALLSGRSEVFNDSFPDNSSEVTENPSGGLTFYLDGAHSPESMEACAKWFSNAVKENKNTLLSSPLSSKVGNITYAWGNGYIKPSERESNIKSKQILLFNCMEVRDPQILLPQLVNTCASSGTHFSNAIFVPNISTYNKVTSGASVTTLDIPARDLSWQFNLQRIWEKIINGKDSIPGKPQKISTTDNLPSLEFLYGDVRHGMCADKCLPRSMVIPSLPLAINWLRDCARENPSLKIQVLVTGSLHLVGDVLKIMRR